MRMAAGEGLDLPKNGWCGPKTPPLFPSTRVIAGLLTPQKAAAKIHKLRILPIFSKQL